MRQRFLLLAAVVLFLSSVMVESALTQQGQGAGAQGGGAQGGGVQVGVPQGRQAGPGRGRQAGPPAKPTPHSADGRVILGGATPSEKGVWLPGGGGGQTLEGRSPCSHGPRRCSTIAQKANLIRAATVRRHAAVPDALWSRVRRSSELQRVYIFDIGGPHLPDDLHGRTGSPTNLASYYGLSIGWWKATLVVDSIGFNEGFWMDGGALPTRTSFTRSSASRAPIR